MDVNEALLLHCWNFNICVHIMKQCMSRFLNVFRYIRRESKYYCNCIYFCFTLIALYSVIFENLLLVALYVDTPTTKRYLYEQRIIITAFIFLFTTFTQFIPYLVNSVCLHCETKYSQPLEQINSKHYHSPEYHTLYSQDPAGIR